MRLAVLISAVLFATAAYAAEWTRYDNARFGYVIAVPPGFAVQHASDNGDGARFSSSEFDSELTVWGGHSAAGDFEGEIAERISADERDGWNVTYRAEAKGWVTYSGSRGDRILYARSVSTCDGEGTANFRLEYAQDDLDAMNPVVMRLARSLEPGSAC